MQTQVLIIGAGATGTGLARDLSLRGISSIIAEKRDVNAGASGGNHGLLHSGARYVFSDPAAARECQLENRMLKRLAPQCIEDTGGLFIAVAGDDESYVADFPELCRKCGIAVEYIDLKTAREMEPTLSSELIVAYAVDDATIDPFKLSLGNMADARNRGGRLLRYSRVIGFDITDRYIRRVQIQDELTGRIQVIEADLVVNAAGAWAGAIAAFAGAAIPMCYSKGSLLVTQNRISRRVINRLRPPADGDILVPGGTVSILGTTSERIISPDDIHPEIHEVDAIIDQGAAMAPILAQTRYIRAYCGVRPLLGEEGASAQVGDDRAVSRGFALIDHAREPEHIQNFFTITGGKLTTFRLMAEKTADLVCRRLGLEKTGRTNAEPLPDIDDARWTEPGAAPGRWLRQSDSDNALICECEMVSQQVVEKIVAGIRKLDGRPSLNAIGLRSRIGKGPCQGAFCSQRLAAYLYDRRHLENHQGLHELRSFLRERWRGQHPLLWDLPLAQAELLEAMHCGLFSLELTDPGDPDNGGRFGGR